MPPFHTLQSFNQLIWRDIAMNNKRMDIRLDKGTREEIGARLVEDLIEEAVIDF